MHESQKVSKKAVENPPYPFVFTALLAPVLQNSQHLRRKPALGLSQKRVCLRSEKEDASILFFRIIKLLLD